MNVSIPAWPHRRWAITLGATAISTYALDAVATAAGVALAASGLLHGVAARVLLGFLAAHLRRLGRRPAAGTWARTGRCCSGPGPAPTRCPRPRTTSRRCGLGSGRGWSRPRAATSAPRSPRRRRTTRARSAQRFVSDSIARPTRSSSSAARTSAPPPTSTGSPVSRGRSSPRGATPPSTPTGSRTEYLADYYAVVEPDEVETIAFFADAIATPRPGSRSCSSAPARPSTTYSCPPAGASEIHLADYLPQNLAEIERWLERDPDAHDWRPFVRYTLECEGLDAPTDDAARSSARSAARKVTRLVEADAGDREPVAERYATVVSAYCADSATADRATWEPYMRHITGLVRPAACSSPRLCAAPAATSSAASTSRAPTSTSTTSRRCSSPSSTARSRSARCPSTRRSALGIVLAWARRRQRPCAGRGSRPARGRRRRAEARRRDRCRGAAR